MPEYEKCRKNNVTSVFLVLVSEMGGRYRPYENASSSVVLYVIERTDLMRKALSISKDELRATGESHPQFHPKVNVSRHHVKISNLKIAAQKTIREWSVNLNNIKVLIKKGIFSCDTARILFYEDILLDPVSFGKRLYHAITAGVNDAAIADNRTAALQLHSVLTEAGVRKVHSDDIDLFVENSNEVLQHFLTTNYPTFASKLNEVHIPCPLNSLMI